MAGGMKREWLRKKMATAVAGTPAGAGGQQQSPRWALRVRALSAALRRRRHGHGPPPASRASTSSAACTRASSSSCCG
ncbi:unnamed protein product [Miscanthus lutarioriparius]|uniref:Uncharacterized protein n=1 Tax=Miscanthus lutarioriparius TaxID=422564 RepID=A0A811RUX2_9POAL|nr:unnamed protein product [Miscanthus lutarioriparius]